MTPKYTQTPVSLPRYDGIMRPIDEIVVESVDSANTGESLLEFTDGTQFSITWMSDHQSQSTISSSSESSSSSSIQSDAIPTEVFLTSGVGTATYSSPEQKYSNCYSTSSDIYSTGLILLELLMFAWILDLMRRMFTTDMQRLSTFQAIRKDPSQLPKEIDDQFPEYKQILISMLSLDPHSRPTADELLKEPVFLKRSKKQLHQTIEEQHGKIEELEARVIVVL